MPVIKAGTPLPDDYEFFNEKWVDLPDYVGIYQVSNKGRVRSIGERAMAQNKGEPKILKWFVDDCGYYRIGIVKDGKQKKYKVHRLIAFAFIPNPKNKLEINHKNGVKTDNRVENLEWSTRSENATHAYQWGLQEKGEKHGRAKLTKDQVIAIRKDRDAGLTTSQIVAKHGTPLHATYKVIINQNWKHLI